MGSIRYKLRQIFVSNKLTLLLRLVLFLNISFLVF